jgi:hypothetical protein
MKAHEMGQVWYLGRVDIVVYVPNSDNSLWKCRCARWLGTLPLIMDRLRKLQISAILDILYRSLIFV